MAFRFAVKTGENELTSCAAVLGRWGCAGIAAPNGEGQQNQGFQAHKRVGWGCIAGHGEACGTRFRRPLRRAVDPNPTDRTPHTRNRARAASCFGSFGSGSRAQVKFFAGGARRVNGVWPWVCTVHVIEETCQNPHGGFGLAAAQTCWLARLSGFWRKKPRS
jgi:hypothetical protein